MKKIIKKHPLITAGCALFVAFVILLYVPTDGTVLQNIRQEFLLALLTAWLLWAMDGKSAFKIQKECITYALKASVLYLTPAALVFIATIVLIIASQGNIQSNWLVLLIEAVLFYFLLGIFEEGMFRGIIFRAFLPKLGRTYRGLIYATILNAFIFGFAHILLGWLQNGVDQSFLGLTQAVVKTLSAGQIGFFFGAIYLKTKNLWGIAFAHGLFDFSLVSGHIIIYGTNSLSYVSSDLSQAVSSIIVQSFMIVIFIPLTIKAIKIIKSVDMPELDFYSVC